VTQVYTRPQIEQVRGALPKPTGKETIADEDFFAAATAALR
jgi:hypothetical protein